MNRPLPVILSAILLGLLAALQLIATALMALAGFVLLHKSLPTSPPPPFAPSFLPIMMFALSLFCTAVAVWSILTLIGLVRLRSWARYSTLIIAGCVTIFAGMATLMSFAMPYLLSSVAAQTPAPNPNMMHGAFFFGGTLCAIFTAIGIAMLVYYNLAKTRTLFLQNAPVNLGPPSTITGRPRPTAITVISWLYLVSGAFSLLYLFLPFPAFFLGFVLYGFAGRLVYLALGALTFAIGYGLHRLHNGARLAVFALFGLCPLQLVILSTPWGRNQFHVYMDAVNAFNARMYTIQHAPPNFASTPGAIVFFSFIGMAGYGVILWLLHRHREAFTPATPVLPLPIDPDPLAG